MGFNHAIRYATLGVAYLILAACGATATPAPLQTPLPTDTPTVAGHADAEVVGVEVGGPDGAYVFSVTVESADTGCDAFADWWEVVTPDGELLYRRVLLHSHVGEQPFTRDGGPVTVGPGDEVIVRAHMSTTGYASGAMRGTFRAGFRATELEPGFASALESLAPLPDGCAF